VERDSQLGASGGSHPIFILCAARSGSTLLRTLLDAHPEIACPPELNLCNIFEAIRLAATAAAAGDDGGEAVERANGLSREIAESILSCYPKREGKRRWCDKSLSSIEKPDLIAEVFPDAQFICLFRDCADTVASIREACDWGYGGFGVEPYARTYAHNMVMAFCMYWADRASALREFEDRHANRCYRVRYEDLVARPEETLGGLFEFLGVARAERDVCAPGALLAAGSAIPGDYKIRYTRGILPDSVGRGWQVPVEMLDPELVERINRLAAELGYQPLLSDLAAIDGPPRDGERPKGRRADAAVEEISGLLSSRAAERLASGAHLRLNNPVDSRLRLILADGDEPWVIDFGQARVEKGGSDGGWTVLTDAQTLLEIIHGQSNPAVALRRSRLRLATEGTERPENFLRHLDALVAVLGDEASGWRQ
jgi:protein-tyrosine sulfotransferase